MPPNKLLLATAVMHSLLSAGHTAHGLNLFKDPAFAKLPALLTATVKAGWFEGSVFFAMMGLINYGWAHSGLNGSTDIGVASMISLLCFGAGGWYTKCGDKGTGVLLAIAGALQGISAKSAL